MEFIRFKRLFGKEKKIVWERKEKVVFERFILCKINLKTVVSSIFFKKLKIKLLKMKCLVIAIYLVSSSSISFKNEKYIY